MRVIKWLDKIIAKLEAWRRKKINKLIGAYQKELALIKKQADHVQAKIDELTKL